MRTRYDGLRWPSGRGLCDPEVRHFPSLHDLLVWLAGGPLEPERRGYREPADPGMRAAWVQGRRIGA